MTVLDGGVKGERGFRYFILLLLLCLPALRAMQAQEQVREQAEARLRQMTPEEIDKALKEHGLTIEEATKRAQAIGISLPDYLSKTTVSTPERDGMMLVDPRVDWQRKVPKGPADDTLLIRSTALRVPARRVDVPGFMGRRGIDTLIQPFGYGIFTYAAETFVPSVSVATPPSYQLGAGDEVAISVWGETQLYHRLQVNREGNIYVPDVGPVSAQGLSVTQFRERLLRRMSGVYSGLAPASGKPNTFMDVSLGKLKTIQVFVLGEVHKPGGYALSSMSSTLDALYLAGGPTVDGTLRNIQVVRRGEAPAPVDLYSYILRGDKNIDPPLQDGDIVFVNPVGKRVAMVGRFLRPAIYEVKDGERLGDVVSLAGGPRFDASIDRLHAERIVPFERRKEYDRDVLDLDFRFAGRDAIMSSRETIENGDIISLFRITDRPENRIVISGNVNKPGRFELQPGMRVFDLIRAADSLQLSTFSERATIFRMLPNQRRQVIGFHLQRAMEGDDQENILLKNEDSVVVYPDSMFFPRHMVSVIGAVSRPGQYPRYNHMSVADLVVLADGLKDGAMKSGWELSRLDTADVSIYTRLIRIDGDDVYWHSGGDKGIILEDFDVLFVPFDPRFSTQKFVTVSGYTVFPGAYSIRFEGERIADIFKRAGGLRPGAYLEGSRLIRKFNNAGLVPLDFRQALDDPASRDNVVVYDGDSIHVAFTEDVIYVNGEVYVPSPVLFKEGAGLSYYIRQAGGYKEEAEDGKTVVFLPGGKKWESGDILPGSSILVPKKIEKPDTALPIIRDLATILASLAALTVALIQVNK